MIIREIVSRRAVREYKPDDIPEEYINEIIKAGQFAPTARNNKAVEFIIIKDNDTKNKIFEIVGQEYVKQAPILIIPATNIQKTNCPIQDLSVASENIFLQATALGLGTVWKALKTEFAEEEKIKKILNIPEVYKIINIIPVGYPKNKPVGHEEEEFDPKKIHKGKW